MGAQEYLNNRMKQFCVAQHFTGGECHALLFCYESSGPESWRGPWVASAVIIYSLKLLLASLGFPVCQVESGDENEPHERISKASISHHFRLHMYLYN